MNQLYTAGELEALVREALIAIAPDLGALDAHTPLIGEQAVVDSVGLVTLLVSVEEKLHGAVDLASSFMAHENPDSPEHPFRTIGSLAAHLHDQLAAPS